MPSRRPAAALPPDRAAAPWVVAGAEEAPAGRRPVTAKGRAMRARLVAASVECFTTRGYHATAVADITAAAGTSHGNFYRYFANVDEALLSAVEAPLARLLNAGRRPDPTDACRLEAIVAWQQAFMTAYAPDRTLLATMREAAAIDRSERFSVAWMGLRRRFLREIELWIDDVATALGPDPDGLTAAALAEVVGAMVEQVAYIHLGLARREPAPAEVAELGRGAALTAWRTVVAARTPPAPAPTRRRPARTHPPVSPPQK